MAQTAIDQTRSSLMLNANLKGRALLRVLYFAPFVLSEVVTGVIWSLLLQPGVTHRDVKMAGRINELAPA